MQSVEKVMQNYVDAYRKLYHRAPSDLRALDSDWVVVNGARMRLSELEYLTQQLQLEYNQAMIDRRGIVNRLIGWLKG